MHAFVSVAPFLSPDEMYMQNMQTGLQITIDEIFWLLEKI